MSAQGDPLAMGSASTERAQAARDFLELSKPGITRMVTIASGVGFAVSAAWHGRLDSGVLVPAIGCLVGTAIASAGANALNQVIEARRDAMMDRTMGRPLPSGRLDSPQAWYFAALCSVLGPAVLLGTNWVAAALAALTIVLYAAFYTPLKPVSPISTYVGAVPGALPCLIGWAAASPEPVVDLTLAPAWSVFSILLVWQIPHFLSIALVYRDQYERAGFRPVPRRSHASAVAWWILVLTAGTVLVSAAPLAAMPELIGLVYASVAAIGGAFFVHAAVRLVQQPGIAGARRVFFTSIAYLPVVYTALVADALVWNAR